MTLTCEITCPVAQEARNMVRHIRTHRSESVHRLEQEWCNLLWTKHRQSFGGMKEDVCLSVSLF